MDRWNNSPGVAAPPLEKWSIGQRIQHILRILREKCTNIQRQKQLKDLLSLTGRPRRLLKTLEKKRTSRERESIQRLRGFENIAGFS